MGGETSQNPLSVFDVGFAHDGGIPPKPLKLYGCLGCYIIYVGTTILNFFPFEVYTDNRHQIIKITFREYLLLPESVFQL